MILDAHHHFWAYDPLQYPWIDDSTTALRRDFLPHHLAPELANVNIDGVITVQARQSLDETRWLLDLAAQHPFIRGVVGWLPLASPQLPELLDQAAQDPALRALRHVLQAEPDHLLMLSDDFNRGLALLHQHDLRYDLLIFERHLPLAIPFVDRHPRQIFILDHLAKPRVKERLLDPWRTNLRELARRPNVYCKLSGLVTEADWTHWSFDQLKTYLDIALDAFGPSRLLFGSDWPVCLLAASYERWFTILKGWTDALSPSEQQEIFGLTAAAAYGLD